MTNPYRSKPLQMAYERGAAEQRAKQAEDGDPPKVLTREEVLAMSEDEINARWPEIQESLRANLPRADSQEADDD